MQQPATRLPAPALARTPTAPSRTQVALLRAPPLLRHPVALQRAPAPPRRQPRVCYGLARQLPSSVAPCADPPPSGARVQLAGPAWNSRRGGKIDQRLELDVGFDPAFEGAAVIDTSGNIVAMAVPGPYHRVLGIPAATIETVLAKVDQFGHLPKPYIGIRLQPLWLDDDTRTKLGRKSRAIAAVGGIDAGSPAAQAHVELGDLLLTLDGEPAESVNALARRIAGTNPGQTVALEVLRGGKPLTINVQIGERPRH